MKTFLLLILLAATSLLSFSQEPLPWSTSFETQTERDAWEQFRLGEQGTYDWGFNTASPVVAGHDYPLGAGPEDETHDWLVSPEIHFHSSSKLSLSVNIFSFGITPDDWFEIWFSNGDKDPAAGDYEMIADLTYFGTNGAWSDTADIIINDTGTGYIALVYHATNNWYTVSVDSIEITPDVPLGTHELSDYDLVPAGIYATQNSINVVKAQRGDMISLHDMKGVLLKQVQVSGPWQEIPLAGIQQGAVLTTHSRNGNILSTRKLFLNL